jgi:hypothetical protein
MPRLLDVAVTSSCLLRLSTYIMLIKVFRSLIGLVARVKCRDEALTSRSRTSSLGNPEFNEEMKVRLPPTGELPITSSIPSVREL